MALYGASVPVEVKPGDEPVAVVVICPNAFAHARLMQALQGIVPEAGVPIPHHATFAPMPEHEAACAIAAEAIRAEVYPDEEPPLRACVSQGDEE